MFAPGFVARIVAVIDPGMRVHLAAQELTQMDAENASSAIAEAIRSSVASRDPKAQAALLAIVQALCTNKFDYLTLEALYRASCAIGHQAIARMLLDPTIAGAEPVHPERPLRPNERPLTLGERKSLARTKNRDLIGLLLRDPHPDVVNILLSNPQVTERDVIRIAAHRPGLPSALRLIAGHPRWLAAPHIRISLVHNPATDVSVAIRLVATLLRQDIATIARDNSLHAEIVAQAQLILQLADTPQPLVN